MPPDRYGSPIYLTLDDVQKIYTADLSEAPHLAIQRDIFVFQCNVGCRIGDLLRLKKRDVINGAIEYIPTKTIKENARTVVVPLNSAAQEKLIDIPIIREISSFLLKALKGSMTTSRLSSRRLELHT